MMFNDNPVFTIRKGDTVVYNDPNQEDGLGRAIVVGHGRNKGRRIVNLDNGHWCYRDDVRSVARTRKAKA